MPKARLINHTTLEVIVLAARTCTATVGKMDCVGDCISEADKNLISRKILKQNKKRRVQSTISAVANAVSELKKNEVLDLNFYASALFSELKEPIHDSVLEHLNYTFKIECSRAVLQELARHRHASLSVQSTRYALKKLIRDCDVEVEFLTVESGHSGVDANNDLGLSELIHLVRSHDLKNDVAKYGLPEAFKTELIWTINARSLRNFFNLRTHKRALKEISELAMCILNALPEPHRFLYDDVIWR